MSFLEVDNAPAIEAKLRYLESTLATAGIGEPVRRIETHLSWLLLGGERVLKLKKPVRSPLLDFTTAQARERNARAELLVNRRLAPRVHLGLLAQWDGGVFTRDQPLERAAHGKAWASRIRAATASPRARAIAKC